MATLHYLLGDFLQLGHGFRRQHGSGQTGLLHLLEGKAHVLRKAQVGKRKRHICPNIGRILVDVGVQLQVPENADGSGPVAFSQAFLDLGKRFSRGTVSAAHRSLGGGFIKRRVEFTRQLLVGGNLLACRQWVWSGLDVARNTSVDLGFETIGNGHEGRKVF
ncbi:hypothetical protein CLUG_03200 [Clavispora lusitaniae ATCC 42720]|uniref:Uncharacterized protein n=1 Tax=Clavispora lusitaniae (strain ATCC 42720) TaxID=306902 RepID=C4Y4W6_CLAL4|nr:uncharacterized protein CLUG_03200 [Clavispora lusitaniae ATCC 42720]EEQ39072.1 hypothetical protein CLUG_03200 [Clavispora lusitaniae ATCC 42720]